MCTGIQELSSISRCAKSICINAIALKGVPPTASHYMPVHVPEGFVIAWDKGDLIGDVESPIHSRRREDLRRWNRGKDGGLEVYWRSVRRKYDTCSREMGRNW